MECECGVLMNNNFVPGWKRMISVCLSLLVVLVTPAYAQALSSVFGTTLDSVGSGAGTNSSAGALPLSSLFVNASLPQIVPAQRVDVQGKSLPGAQITLFLNDVRVRVSSANAQGVFVFSSVALLPGHNAVLLLAEQNGQQARQQADVEVDVNPPNISMNIPEIALHSPLEINVTSSKPVTVRYSVLPESLVAGTSGSSGSNNGSVPEHVISGKGTFVFPLDLGQGRNVVRVSVTDVAGHSFERVVETVFDTVPPQFLQDSLNLKDLSPSYTSDIKVRGKISEPATVFAFLNNDKTPSARVLTTSDGAFELPLTLMRDVKFSAQKARVSLETGQSSVNNVRLEAVDAAGLRTVLPPMPVTYAVCGQGNAYHVELGQPIPDLLNTRLLLQGLQQVGFTVKLDYAGGLQSKLNPDTGVSLRSLTLSPEVAKEYDNDLVQSAHIQLKPTSNTSSVGYATLVLQSPFLDANEDNQTVYSQELNLSEHRKGDCLLPGFGCMRFFLEMELSFQEKSANPKFLDPNTRTTLSTSSVTTRVQKVCVPIEVAIDKRVPPSILPQGLLTSTVELLGSAVNAIDTVLKPLTTLGTYILYACLAGMVLVYGAYVRERMSCEFSSALQSAFSEKPWNKEVAATGLCDTVYEGQEAQRSACGACSAAVLARKNLENKFFRTTCDRISCPSAPSLMTHIRNNEAELTPLAIAPEVANKIVQQHPELSKLSEHVNDKFKKQFTGENLVFSGSDCAFTIARNYGDKKDLYSIAGQYSNLKDEVKPKTVDCDGLHPATPECCAYEYQQQWGTACGLSSSNTDTFSEIKESTCLAAQKTVLGVKKFESDFGESCNRLWNAAAGFCDPNSGDPAPEIIATGHEYTDSMKNVLGSAKDRDVFLQVRPVFKSGSKDVDKYVISRGYVHDRYVYQRAASTTTTADANDKSIFAATKDNHDKDDSTRWLLNSRLDFFQEKTIDADVFASGLEELPKGKLKESPDAMTQTAKLTRFGEQICAGLKDEEDCKRDITSLRELYDKVRGVIGVADQEYIVKPTSGFLRSMQCVCIPAVTSYLELWRNILNWGKLCFTSILVTGDGSSGACRAGLSMYVCDLLYELISCAASKYSSPGANGRIGSSGIGNFFGAITSAGSDVSNSVCSRYGDSTLYNSLFVQRKLIHSACAFAFTGAWDLDVEALFKQSVQEVPVESQGYLTKCERRFQGFDPSSDPSGRSTWTYHTGALLFAGAPLRYDIKLICSAGPKCAEADGFKNGMCDCPKGEKSISLSDADLTGVLAKNGVLDKELLYTVGAGGDPNDDVRYDRLVLSWDAEDPVTHKILPGKAECKLSQVGADPPAFCSFDPFSFSYRCAFAFGGEGAKFTKAGPSYPAKHDVLADKKSAIASATGCRQTFGVGESPSFSVSVRQQIKEETRKSFQSQKFLRTVIKRVVPGASDQIMYALPEDKEGPYDDSMILFKQGEFEIPVKIPDFKFDETQFTSPTKIPASGVQVFVHKNTPSGSIVEQDDSVLSLRPEDVLDKDGVVVKETVRLLFKFNTIDQKSVRMTVFKGISNPPSFTSGAELVAPLTLDWPVGASSLTLPELELVSSDKTTQLTLKNLVLKHPPVPGTSSEVYVFIPAAATRTGATSSAGAASSAGCDSNKVETWKAEFTLFDADKFGTPSSQVSVNPATGDLAVMEVPFNVMCADPVKATDKIGDCGGAPVSVASSSASPATASVMPEFSITPSPLHGLPSKIAIDIVREFSLDLKNIGKISALNTVLDLLPVSGVSNVFFSDTHDNNPELRVGTLVPSASTGPLLVTIVPVKDIKPGSPLVFTVAVISGTTKTLFKIVAPFDSVSVPVSVSTSTSTSASVDGSSSSVLPIGAPSLPVVIPGSVTTVVLPSSGAVCGNGVVEKGEVCDTAPSSTQLIVPTAEKNPEYYVTAGFSDVHGNNVLVLFDAKKNEVISSIDLDNACKKLTAACTTVAIGLPAGQCSPDCKTFRPLLSCSKEGSAFGNFFGAAGFSNWFGPGVVADKDKGVVPESPEKFVYVGSDLKSGNDKCTGGTTRSVGDEVSIS